MRHHRRAFAAAVLAYVLAGNQARAQEVDAFAGLALDFRCGIGVDGRATVFFTKGLGAMVDARAMRCFWRDKLGDPSPAVPFGKQGWTTSSIPQSWVGLAGTWGGTYETGSVNTTILAALSLHFLRSEKEKSEMTAGSTDRLKDQMRLAGMFSMDFHYVALTVRGGILEGKQATLGGDLMFRLGTDIVRLGATMDERGSGLRVEITTPDLGQGVRIAGTVVWKPIGMACAVAGAACPDGSLWDWPNGFVLLRLVFGAPSNSDGGVGYPTTAE